ncbi:Ero1-like protein [Strongyloides ratti]|uniref:Ero1-like protein n=1 Tax=Strongyloides ratti TaxID=34506 RepID=A0A090MWW3_STRRB|nr:Ero1-like protein [Strongyloides ratti]CEF64384.1 Ero1-like protein [Strongyloides ratti]
MTIYLDDIEKVIVRKIHAIYRMKKKNLIISILLNVILFSKISKLQFVKDNECFCAGHDDSVEVCPCNYDSIDDYNNRKIFPLIQNLLEKDSFKFYKVNMEKTCPFWADDRECGSKECGIENCDDEVPEILKTPLTLHIGSSCGENSNSFDPLDRSLTEIDKAYIESFEESTFSFCAMEDESEDGMHYVNLYKNPERYTGYKGNSAQKVWMTIYQENCFKPDPKFDKNFLLNPSNKGLCLEKRVFYRLISGLHSAITISIASHNYKPGPFGQGTWFRNDEMFKGRFGTKWSWEGPERLKNVYFVYLLEMKALSKLVPYLNNELFYTGNKKEDDETKLVLEKLMSEIEQSPNSFDEQGMFTGPYAPSLREEFRIHFHNISRIMDCVACDKCRLWGKLQTHGMGTALKILFMDLTSMANKIPYWLTRNDIVALFQSFGRYASSIREVEEFRKLYLYK